MPLKIIKLLALIFVCNSYHLYGQEWHIKGQVAGDKQQPLASATIALLDTNNKVILKTSADNSGHFSLLYTINGNYSLLITYTGYKEYRSTVFELANKDFGTILLTPGANTLSEIHVTSKQNLIELDGNNIVYNVAKSINSQGLNAFEVLIRL